MKKYKEFTKELDENKKQQEQMRGWVYRQIEDTNKTHSQIKREFIQKFGAANTKFFDQYVSDFMD